MTPKLEYVGDAHGDRNDATEYRIVCSCGAPLGRLGLLTRQSDGQRKTICENCGYATAFRDAQIVLHVPAPQSVLDAHGITPLRIPREVVGQIDMRDLLRPR